MSPRKLSRSLPPSLLHRQAELATDAMNAAAFSSGIISNSTVISDLLEVIDSLDLVSTKFQPGWDTIANEYTQTLTLLQSFASLIASTADQMQSFVLPFVLSTDTPATFKVASLQSFLANQTAVVSISSSALESAFDSWNNDITAFSTMFNNFAATQNPSGDTQQILEEIQSLSLLMTQVNSFATSTQALAAATGTNPLVMFGNLIFPTFYSEATIEAAAIAEILSLNDLALITQYQGLLIQILAAEATIQDLRDDLSVVSAARGFISSTATFNRDSIANQIEMLSSTYVSGLRQDTDSLILFLQEDDAPQVGIRLVYCNSIILINSEHPGIKPTILQVFVAQGTTIYSSLASALGSFAQMIKL
ncbi:hypothetical protein BC834DRAFT_886268 [Gloeopeniophorella convolvens]|nr:hypothetical protein BC834DRAFT_886268 [Gloeopeniophorella convolvens]